MENNKSSIGSIIGTIIIIALIILGGLYFWGKRIEEQKVTQAVIQENIQTNTPVNSEAEAIKSVSSSDSVSSIEADLQATQTDNLAPEIAQ